MAESGGLQWSDGTYARLPCLTSNDGPWDDEAFNAGYQLGEISQALSMRPMIYSTSIFSDLIDCVDMLAMAYDYTVRVNAVHGRFSSISIVRSREGLDKITTMDPVDRPEPPK